MNTFESSLSNASSDAELVTASRTGDRTAFRHIVERYQTLICSVAYSATGDVGRSEDLAQETFVTAWTRLEGLREPDKLRSWLCGIVRNRILKQRELSRRDPSQDAAPLEDAETTPSHEVAPLEATISREEQALLWRSLERIPEAYREPLVLFYRKHQSVAEVAEQLGLTEDAAKQRLSRGRHLLQDEVRLFVEGALRKTAPGQVFCSTVFASLPVAAMSAAASTGTAAATGSATTKAFPLAAWLAPLAGVIAGLVAQLRLVGDTMPRGKSRNRIVTGIAATWVAVAAMAVGGDAIVAAVGRHYDWGRPAFFIAYCLFWWAFAGAAISLMYAVSSRQFAPAAAMPASLDVPIRTSTLAWSAGGFHIAVFSWFIFVAWRLDDTTAAVAIAVTMAALTLWTVLSFRGKSVVRATAGLARRTWLACGVALGALNLRLDAWLAAGYGLSVAEVHRLLPLWIVPLLSVLLVAWVAALVRTGRPARP